MKSNNVWVFAFLVGSLCGCNGEPVASTAAAGAAGAIVPSVKTPLTLDPGTDPAGVVILEENRSGSGPAGQPGGSGSPPATPGAKAKDAKAKFTKTGPVPGKGASGNMKVPGATLPRTGFDKDPSVTKPADPKLEPIDPPVHVQ